MKSIVNIFKAFSETIRSLRMVLVLLLLILTQGLFAWTTVSPSQTPPIRSQIMGWERVCFASAINCAIVIGGYQQASSEPQNAIMAYSIRNNRWDIVDLGSGISTHTDYVCTGGHDEGCSCYDENLHAFVTPQTWAMGSANFSMCHYDVRGNIGRQYYPASSAGNMNSEQTATCFDTDSGCIYYLGGSPNAANFCRYRPVENKWKILPNCPGSVVNATIAYDKIQKKVIVPGGYVYNPATNAWSSASTPGNPVLYNELLGRCESVSKSICPSAAVPYAFDPFDNQYVCIEGCGGGSYGSQVSTQASSASNTKPLLTFTKLSYASDTRWNALGSDIQSSALGWSRAPRIVGYNNELHLAWAEYEPANWNNEGGIYVRLAKWTGSAWQAKGKVGTGNYSDFPGLFTNNNEVCVGVDNLTTFKGATATHYRFTSTAIETLGTGGPITNGLYDNTGGPQLVFYKGNWHSLYFRSRTWREYGGLGHSRWNEATKTWSPVDTAIIASPYALTADSTAVLLSAMASGVIGDSLICAFTSTQMSGRPLTIGLRCYDGTSWKKLAPISASSTATVAMHPAMASDPVNHALYLAYLKRPFIGRKNSELVVERWNGSGWSPMGNALNVNDSTKDAWAFRPSLAVNSTGVLYCTWTEHVWGSCPQVYVAHWNGSAWMMDTEPGKSLNIDGTNGSAQNPCITFQNDKPTVAWCEHVFGNGNFRKVYVKQLDQIQNKSETVSTHSRVPVLSVLTNPVCGSGLVDFSLRMAGSPKTMGSLRIVDVRGRVIASLGAAPRVTWNPRMATGQYAVSGLYIAQWKDGDNLLSSKSFILIP